MISFIGNRPVLQIGRQQVTGYGTEWLRDAIEQGAIAAERHDFPFTDELLQGINHYLENKCPLRVLTVEDLHSRIRKMLQKIGCESIAETLPLTAPPVTLSLSHAAEQAGNGFELAFFNHLHDEIEDLRSHGVKTLRFTKTKECVQILRGIKRWTTPCEKLHQEILNFLQTHGQPAEKNSAEVKITLSIADSH